MRVLVAFGRQPFAPPSIGPTADSMLAALKAGGFEADSVEIPMGTSPDGLAIALDIASRLSPERDASYRPVDRLIALDPIASLSPHPRRSHWWLQGWPPAMGPDRPNFSSEILRDFQRLMARALGGGRAGSSPETVHLAENLAPFTFPDPTTAPILLPLSIPTTAADSDPWQRIVKILVEDAG